MERTRILLGFGFTSVVPDVMGLNAFYDDAKPVRVLPGTAKNSVRVLVPDSRPQGFLDVVLQDVTIVAGLAVSMTKMCDLRRLWPQSLLTEMTRWRRRPSGLLTARQTTILWPGKLQVLWHLLRHLMTPMFPLHLVSGAPLDC